MERQTNKLRRSTVQMMFNPHDPLEELQRAERGQENDYFHKLDQELLETLREKSVEEAEQAIRHYTRMRCPQCGEPLKKKPYRRGTMEACPECEGIWLDKRQWEGIGGSGWLQRLLTGLTASKG